jgi:hypothetical protein
VRRRSLFGKAASHSRDGRRRHTPPEDRRADPAAFILMHRISSCKLFATRVRAVPRRSPNRAHAPVPRAGTPERRRARWARARWARARSPSCPTTAPRRSRPSAGRSRSRTTPGPAPPASRAPTTARGGGPARGTRGRRPAAPAGPEANVASGLSGHAPHALFGRNLSPDVGDRPDGVLAGAVIDHFGGSEVFRRQRTAATTSVGLRTRVPSWTPLGRRLIVGPLRGGHGNPGEAGAARDRGPRSPSGRAPRRRRSPTHGTTPAARTKSAPTASPGRGSWSTERTGPRASVRRAGVDGASADRRARRVCGGRPGLRRWTGGAQRLVPERGRGD